MLSAIVLDSQSSKTSSNTLEKEQQICGICKEPLSSESQWHHGGAGEKHPFHRECIRRSTGELNQIPCPICRTVITPFSCLERFWRVCDINSGRDRYCIRAREIGWICLGILCAGTGAYLFSAFLNGKSEYLPYTPLGLAGPYLGYRVARVLTREFPDERVSLIGIHLIGGFGLLGLAMGSLTGELLFG